MFVTDVIYISRVLISSAEYIYLKNIYEVAISYSISNK